MNRFAALLDRLAYEPGRNAKLRLMAEHFRTTPDPARGWTLAALTGALSFRHAKPSLIRALVAERVDPVLFALSYDYVGDLSETAALIWPAADPDAVSRRRDGELPFFSNGWTSSSQIGSQSNPGTADGPDRRGADQPTISRMLVRPASGEPGTDETGGRGMGPSLSEVVTALASLGKTQLPSQLARWLDMLDDTGRWALLKLVTGGLRVGVSARLAKTAVAAIGAKDPDEVEVIWPSLAPPYLDLFAWVEGRAAKPASNDPAPFRPVMLAHAVQPGDLADLGPSEFAAEWKWDGIRVQAVAGRGVAEALTARLYSRTGEDISKSFPDLVEALTFEAAIDGELLVMRDGRVQSFNALQQRLNRKNLTPDLLTNFPAHLRAYDLLVEGREDLRPLPFVERRSRLERLVQGLGGTRVDLSPLVAFKSWEQLAAARAHPAQFGAGANAGAIEGIMLKRRDAPYLPGRPKGLWWKWKRDPHIIDAVLMYAQRGHGKRSSFYSDYTFGVWAAGLAGDELVPVGKAYFGFTDQELSRLDRFVRQNTVNRFGPVREVVHEPASGLVLEVAFEGLQRSTRHKSGIAMRFPRINRLRWDKPPGEADRLETLQGMLEAFEFRGE